MNTFKLSGVLLFAKDSYKDLEESLEVLLQFRFFTPLVLEYFLPKIKPIWYQLRYYVSSFVHMHCLVLKKLSERLLELFSHLKKGNSSSATIDSITNVT